MQTGPSSSTANITQQYLKETFGRHFIRKNKRSSSSPDWNPLDHYFRDAVKRKVYEGRRERFTSLAELKKRIRKVWNDAFDIATLRKAILEFRPRLQAVVTENGGPIKVHLAELLPWICTVWAIGFLSCVVCLILWSFQYALSIFLSIPFHFALSMPCRDFWSIFPKWIGCF